MVSWCQGHNQIVDVEKFGGATAGVVLNLRERRRRARCLITQGRKEVKEVVYQSKRKEEFACAVGSPRKPNGKKRPSSSVRRYCI